MADDVLGPYPSGDNSFDVVIGDIKPGDLPGRISQALGVPYLADLKTRPNPVNGIVFHTGDGQLRLLVTLPVSACGRSVATHFILDTGAPRSYIAQSVSEALELPETTAYSQAVLVNGVRVRTPVSDTAKVSSSGEELCHFGGLNILGTGFLDLAEVKLQIDVSNKLVTLTSPQFSATKAATAKLGGTQESADGVPSG